MKYLGVEIRTDGWGFFCSKTEGVYFGIDNLKSDIRKLILPTYQPTKTLAWLEEQTGLEWKFNLTERKLNTYDIYYKWVPSYDLSDNTAYCINDKIKVSAGGDGDWIKMSPREFINKIAKGEWI